MGRTLALDVGDKRTGAAITDDLNITAQPVGVRERTGYKTELSWVRELMREYEIERVVLGHPLNLDGTAGQRALACENIARKLARDLKIEVELYDERFSTAAADRVFDEAGASRKKRGEVIDQTAAQLILMGWLAARGGQTSGG